MNRRLFLRKAAVVAGATVAATQVEPSPMPDERPPTIYGSRAIREEAESKPYDKWAWGPQRADHIAEQVHKALQRAQRNGGA